MKNRTGDEEKEGAKAKFWFFSALLLCRWNSLAAGVVTQGNASLFNMLLDSFVFSDQYEEFLLFGEQAPT